MARVGVLNNPHAGGNKNGKIDRFTLESLLCDNGGVFVDVDEDIDRAIDYVEKNNVDVVASNGGDGTFHRILNRYIKGQLEKNKFLETTEIVLPRFLVLPSGTANVIAYNSVRGENTETVLKRVINTEYYNLKILNVRTLYINCDEKDQFGTIFAAGSVYNFMQIYENLNNGKKNKKKALDIILKGTFNSKFGNSIIKTTNADLQIGEGLKDEGYSALLVCGFKPNIVGIKPFNELEDMDNGLYCAYTKMGRIKLIMGLPLLLMGKKINGANYFSGVEEIRIKSNEKIGYTLDGELFEGHDIIINPGPTIKIIKI